MYFGIVVSPLGKRTCNNHSISKTKHDNSENFQKCPNASERTQNASDCIQTHPNASEHIRTDPNTLNSSRRLHDGISQKNSQPRSQLFRNAFRDKPKAMKKNKDGKRKKTLMIKDMPRPKQPLMIKDKPRYTPLKN